MSDPTPYLDDIIQAIERIRRVMGDTPLPSFKADWQKQWPLQRRRAVRGLSLYRLS